MFQILSIRKYVRALTILALLVWRGANKKEPNTSSKAKGIHTQEKWKHNQFLNSNLNEKQSRLTALHRPSTSSSAAVWFQKDTCTDLLYYILMPKVIKNTNRRRSHRGPR